MGATKRIKKCTRCGKTFEAKTCAKRCELCRGLHAKEVSKEWHKQTYKPRGYNQSGSNNNNWSGGTRPDYYGRVAIEAHGNLCADCGIDAVLTHHKDGNRRNNDPSNLERLCKRCHQLRHDCANNLPSVVIFREKPCARCGFVFQPTGPRSKYCCSCGGKSTR